MVVPLTKMDLQKGRQVSRGKSREEKKKIVHLFLYTSEMSKGHLEEELVNALMLRKNTVNKLLLNKVAFIFKANLNFLGKDRFHGLSC